MLKLLRIWSWVGLMAVLAAAAGIYGMHDRFSAWWASGRSPSAVGQQEQDWRQRELLFLKQIHDRLETQLQAEGGNAPASLRREQQAILQRIEETAKPIRDQVPPGIRGLLSDSSSAETAATQPVTAATAPPVPAAAPLPVASVGAPAAPAAAPIPAPEPVELRLGSATAPGINLDVSSLSRDAELDRAVDRVQKIRKTRPAKPPEAKAAEAKPADAKVTPAKPAEPKPAEAKPAATASEAGASSKQ
jgi:hypothetical protein